MIRSEKGVSAVEFALIVPLLFVLTFGIIEFALLLFDKAVVTNASREGARAAIVYHFDGSNYAPLTDAKIKEVVTDYTQGYLVNLGKANNTPVVDVDPPEPRVSGGDVNVTVTFTYDLLILPDLSKLLGGSTFTGTVDLVGKTTMRME